MWITPWSLHIKIKPKERGVIWASGDEKLDRGNPQNHHKRCWQLEKKKRISVCPLLCHSRWGDHVTNRAFSKRSFSRGTKWGLSAINKAAWKQRDILKKSKALAGMTIISPCLLESDMGLGPCRKGCSARGQLYLMDIPPTGTHCRLISSANGQNQNVSGSLWYCTCRRTADG